MKTFSMPFHCIFSRFFCYLASLYTGALLLNGCSSSHTPPAPAVSSYTATAIDKKKNMCMNLISMVESFQLSKIHDAKKYAAMQEEVQKSQKATIKSMDYSAQMIARTIYADPFSPHLHQAVYNYCGNTFFYSMLDLLHGSQEELYRAFHFTPNWSMPSSAPQHKSSAK